MNAIVNWASRLFGMAMIALSIFVALETILRKLANFSFEGADELGGYVLAVGSSLAFTVALADRAHIRVDLLHQRFPVWLQALTNWLAVVSLTSLACLMTWLGYGVIRDTMDYGSTAATPWATPLIYPQSLWYAALSSFALVASWQAVRCTVMLLRHRYEQLNRDFHPKGAMEELEDEIEDLSRR